MALFNKENAAEKQAQKSAEILAKYGLETVSDPDTVSALREIAFSMSANKFIETGAALTGKSEDVAKLGYLKAIVEQNFIIIKLLDKLNK